jgi:hypothetical protein
MKDDDDPDDPLVTFVADCISAYYQTPEEEEFYVDPPPEWLAARRVAGLDDSVIWKLKKQLPGRRAGAARWMDHVAHTFSELGLEKNLALPNFYRKEFTRLVVDTHMDDFHGTGRRSEVTPFLEALREKFKLKASDCIIVGAYTHLKRTRLKLDIGVFLDQTRNTLWM